MVNNAPIARRRIPVTIVALLLALFTVPFMTDPSSAAASANATATNPGADQAEEGAGPGKLMLVMDSSGSMKEPTGGGQTRIQAAKGALGEVIGQLPDDQEVGLRVYGAKVFSRDDKGACTDSQRVVDLGSDNRGELRNAVKKYRPYGETPIGYALQEAGTDLGDSGQRNIVLVSDGEPNCEPDPCEVARDLGKQGISLHIDVVGLDVNDTARKKLECIARAGNGNYYDANNSKELADSMVHVAERSARSFEPIGEPVTGTPDEESAPEITEGDWRDVADPKNPTTYYRIKRGQQNSTIQASVAYRAVGSTEFVDASLTTPEGDRCEFNTGLATDDQLSSAVVSANPYGDEACMESEELILEVEYRADTPAVPLEIRVTELAAVANLDALPEPDSDVTYQAPPKSGKTQEVTGGTSFNDAEPLTPGSYSGTIVPGESLTFRIEADWGQQPVAAASFPPASGDLEPAAKGNAHVLLDVFSPGRARSASTFTEPSTEAEVSLLTTSKSKASATTTAVNFANFQNTDPDNGPTAAGDYTIVLTLQDTGENASLPMPYQLDVGVNGEAQPGPEFDEQPIEGVEPQPTESGSDEEASGESSEAGDTDSDDGLSGLGLAFGGLGLLALLGAAGFLLRNKFRSS
ncbi:MAG: VWA domain-containing protein [Nocardioides sp.]|nr:VWA domain-containing protein [Nocardioides sp.]